MSWFRAAVIRAVEAGAGGKDNITRTVRNYAGTVVHHAGNAVVEGAKIIQDRIGSRNMQGFKQTVKRLEEISVSSRGVERVQLLRRWLVALKEVDRFSSGSIEGDKNSPTDQLNDETKDSPKNPTLVYYVDPDMGGELKTFRDVFLTSQALEGITLHMILEEATDEEESLLLEIYGLCLLGGKEVHQEIMMNVHNLANAFSEYQDEALVKREELLQHVQDAIAGLKINADFDRIDAKACSLKKTLDEKKGEMPPSSGDRDNTSDDKTTSSKVLQEILSQVQLYSKLEELLLKKKLFNEVDSPQLHAEKVDKLRILSESLANSTLKAEKRIVDQREQREDALNFRLAKSEEMVQAEKELTYDIRELENQKDQLEAELEKVNTLLSSARMRLHNAREEREHFDEASSQMLVHLKTKEDELFKSVASYKVEATAVNACKNLLENTWDLRISQRQKTEELVDGELEKYGDYFVKLVISLLSSYKEKLEPSLSSIRKLEENLSSMKELLRPTFLRSDVSPNTDDGSLHVDQQRRKLEEEYLYIESKFVSTLSTVDTVRMQFYETKGVVRNFDEKVQEKFDALEKIKQEFESIKRPKLLIETTRQRSELAVNEKSHIDSSSSEQTAEVRRLKFEDINDSLAKGTKNFSMKAEMEKPDSTVEVDTVDSNEEINDWEFDELGRDYDAPSNDQRR
ncbi:myosin-6-like [Cucurbita maxima]|uniref:Myosin-6-like n=1 Tax=Cucurbita maxima TaxID=3661 RepID=A0A6J1IMJ3_CUCMA|nr:myosin-6-like [Cucurbita maxima]